MTDAAPQTSWWRVRPKPLKLNATPALRGLQADGQLFPWMQVYRSVGSDWDETWRPYDQSGESLTARGRPLHLQVHRKHLVKLARRAHARGLKQAWSSGRFSMQATGFAKRTQAAIGLVASIVMAIALVSLVVHVILQGWQRIDLQVLDLRGVLSFAIPAVLMLACTFPALVLVWLAVQAFRGSHLQHIRIDGQGIEARMDYGTVMQLRWAEIQDYDFCADQVAIRAADGQVFRLGPLPRQMLIALRIIKPLAIRPEVMRARMRRELLCKGFVAVLFFLFAVGAGELARYLIADAPENKPPLVAFVIIGAFAASAWLATSAHSSDWLATTQLGKRLLAAVYRKRRLRSAKQRKRATPVKL